MSKKRTANGTRHPGHKLTDDQVVDIRTRHAAGEASQALLGREFGVTQGAIYGVLTGRLHREPTHPPI